MHVAYSKTEGEPTSFDEEVQTEIRSTSDVLMARQMGRVRALSLGFGRADASLVAAAISEVARNIVEHARAGEIVVCGISEGGRRGLRIIARDRGPGISDIEGVTQYGLSSRAGVCVGIPGTKLLVDEFDIVSAAGTGTTVTMTKWVAA
jgi:serine/threonine-protein kinase RsbT